MIRIIICITNVITVLRMNELDNDQARCDINQTDVSSLEDGTHSKIIL